MIDPHTRGLFAMRTSLLVTSLLLGVSALTCVHAATIVTTATEKEHHLAKTASMEAALKELGDKPIKALRVTKCESLQDGEQKRWRCTAVAEY